jgi:tight adherence protein B
VEENIGFFTKSNVIIGVGILVFVYVFRNANKIFTWIENQTFGTRNYIQEKFDLIFFEAKDEHVTYVLLVLSIGLGLFTLAIFGFLGKWGMGVFFACILSFIGFKIPKPIVDMLVENKTKLYSDQMVDALTLLSNGIRAGLSMPQAIGMIVDEMPAPISQEFNLMLQQNRIGVPLEECFEGLVKRVPTEDNDMFVSGVNILRETGGNLAETFDTIVGVIRERIRVQQKVDQYTAQGKFQGYTIAAMPFAIGGIYYVSDPNSMTPLFTTLIGNVFLVLALGLDAIGLFVILKIVKIKT